MSTWMIAGVAVPFSCIPLEPGFPTVFPIPLGRAATVEDYGAMFVLQPEHVRLNYLTGDDGIVVGYQVLLVAEPDPVPDLEARWGPATDAPIAHSADIVSRRIWRVPGRQLAIAVVQLRRKPFWNIDFVREG